ncbi:hypothetical protein ACHAQA_004555 [Verticillium albo-atrum]
MAPPCSLFASDPTPIEDDWEKISETRSVISMQSSDSDIDGEWMSAVSPGKSTAGGKSTSNDDDLKVALKESKQEQKQERNPHAPTASAIDAKPTGPAQVVDVRDPVVTGKHEAEKNTGSPAASLEQTGKHQQLSDVVKPQPEELCDPKNIPDQAQAGSRMSQVEPTSTPLTTNNLKKLNDSLGKLSLVGSPQIQTPNGSIQANPSTGARSDRVNVATVRRVPSGHQILMPFRRGGKIKGHDADPTLLQDLLKCLLAHSEATTRLMPKAKSMADFVVTAPLAVSSVINLASTCKRITASLQVLMPILCRYASTYEKLIQEPKATAMQIPLDGSLHNWMNRVYEELQGLQTTLIGLISVNFDGGCVASWSDLARFEEVLGAYQVQMQTYMAVIIRQEALDYEEFFPSPIQPAAPRVREHVVIDPAVATWPLPIPMELKYLRRQIRITLMKIGLTKCWLPAAEQLDANDITVMFTEIATRLVERKNVFRTGASYLQFCGTFLATLDPTLIRDFALELEEINEKIGDQEDYRDAKDTVPKGIQVHVDRVFIEDGRLLELQSIAEVLTSMILPATARCRCPKRKVPRRFALE